MVAGGDLSKRVAWLLQYCRLLPARHRLSLAFVKGVSFWIAEVGRRAPVNQNLVGKQSISDRLTCCLILGAHSKAALGSREEIQAPTPLHQSHFFNTIISFRCTILRPWYKNGA